jgi:hypothetical protein
VLLLGVLAAPMPAGADDLGRLFFTPQQRQELDRRRNTDEKASAEAVVERTVTVNGQVTRSSGHSTTWVNGVPQNDAYRSVDRTHVRLEDATVKVGQTLDRNRGQVTDELKGGTVTVRPPRSN